MATYTVQIPDAEGDRLRELAHDALRSPRHHAAFLLIEAIRRAEARRDRRTPPADRK